MSSALLECRVENATRTRISTERVSDLIEEISRRAQKNIPVSKRSAWRHYYKGAALSIIFVGKRASRALNKKLRHQDKATDVLSFQYTVLREDHEKQIGEVVLCPAIIAQQARKRGVRFEDEFAHTLVHGALHVFGNHHEEGEEKTVWIHKEEDIILKKFGYAPAH